MNRKLLARLASLEQAAPKSDGVPMCAHHGPACSMGAEPLSDLYVLIIQAKQRQGEEVPPLDEHRPMTAAERADYRRGYEAALADARARVAAEEAEIRGERP